jgi:hypothetical protein
VTHPLILSHQVKNRFKPLLSNRNLYRYAVDSPEKSRDFYVAFYGAFADGVGLYWLNPVDP